MDYAPGKVPSKNEWDIKTTTKTKTYDPVASNVKLVGDDMTEKDYDTFFEGFNDPWGEKREQERQQKEQERKEKFANIRANADKRNWPSRNETDAFLDGVNGTSNTNEQKVKFQNTQLHAKPQDYSLRFSNTEFRAAPTDMNLRFPNTQIQAKSQDAVFHEDFNDSYEEKERWEEQEEKISNPNTSRPNILGIAPMGREGSMWCWIAAASMVDEHYHPESFASQQEIANRLGKGTNDGGYIEEDPNLGKGSRSCTTSGFSDRISASELTYEKIQEEMQGKHPIVLLTQTGDRYESEHYVVIVGCYTDEKGEKYVVVNETREKETKTGKNGVQRHIPYEQLKGAFSTGRGKDQRIKAFYTTRPEKDSYHK